MSVWPAMKRIEDDREVVIYNSLVMIHDKDHERLLRVTARSQSGPLAPYTTFMQYRGLGQATRGYISGECPAPHGPLVETLAQLHEDGPQRNATREELRAFYEQRILNRIERNCPQHYDLVVNWPGWERLVYDRPNVTWGVWHGDASDYNAVETQGGRIVLFDHAPEPEGPQEYDFAKLKRSLYIDNTMTLRKTPRLRDDVLTAVIAGMIGSHGHPNLVELFKCMSAL